MSLLKLFRREPAFAKPARELVPAAAAYTTAAYTTLLDHHPFIGAIQPQQWDFFATVGAVSAALIRLADIVEGGQFNAAYPLVIKELKLWDAQGEAALLDCQKFVKSGFEKGNTTPPALIGMWVLWNLFQRQPTLDEIKAAQPIGMMLSVPFNDWWQDK